MNDVWVFHCFVFFVSHLPQIVNLMQLALIYICLRWIYVTHNLISYFKFSMSPIFQRNMALHDCHHNHLQIQWSNSKNQCVATQTQCTRLNNFWRKLQQVQQFFVKGCVSFVLQINHIMTYNLTLQRIMIIIINANENQIVTVAVHW